MFKLSKPEETDFYNETMDYLGPNETNTYYSVWQAIPRDIGKTKKPRVMAGSKAIINTLVEEGNEFDFAMLKDGMPFFPGDPVIQVIGNKSNARKLEPKLLSTLFYMTEIASRAKEWTDALGQDRVIDVGMRATAPGAWNFATESFLIGGGKLTASTGVRNVPYLKEGIDYKLIGTTGHSLYLEYMTSGYNQREAFAMILDKFEAKNKGKPCALLVDTVDSKIGIDDALSVILTQKKKTGQTHYMRLDSSTPEFGLEAQARYALENLISEIPDFKVIIEDGLTLETALEYEKAFEKAGLDPKKHILYGAGGAFVNNITRDNNGAWAYKPSVFKTLNFGKVPVVKLSSNPLKNSLAGLVGLSYDTTSSRLVSYDEKSSVNKVMTKDQLEIYMRKSLDELRSDAALYWTLVKDAPNRWYESYDLDDNLKIMRENAIAKTIQFGRN